VATQQLQVILASTRPGRVGAPIARWFLEHAKAHSGFETELVDLAEWNLPFLDEPRHPKLGLYEHDHTRRWSEKIGSGDAYVFVTPEYNYGYTAPLKNAIDYLAAEWKDKPVGFVSYGGIAGGTRAVQMLKQVVTTLKMVPVFEAVNIPFVQTLLDTQGELAATVILDEAATLMLDEIDRLGCALAQLRVP